MSNKILKPEPTGVKGHDPHKTAVESYTPDNPGVPSGFSVSILIKLMAIHSLVITPLIA